MDGKRIVIAFVASSILAACSPGVKDSYKDDPTLPSSSAALETLSSPATEADVAAGKEFLTSTGVKVTGTMTTGVSILGVDGVKSFSIPAGYYDGSKTATAQDADLVATNILSGTTIFGVAGSAIAAYANCTDNALNAGQCSTAAGRYVSGTLGGAITGANGQLTKPIPAGYYDGSTSCTMSDTNLIAGNIMQSVTLFGVSGSIVNRGALDASGAAAYPGAGYYNAAPILPAASKIASGSQILGVAGTASFPDFTGTTLYRDKTTVTEISQRAENDTGTCSDVSYTDRKNCESNVGTWTPSVPTNHRLVPAVTKDDEGYSGTSITYATRPTVDCGAGIGTIEGRIADCETKNVASSPWDGSTKGNSGQGTWRLVTRQGANKEVWRDERTGLLWSSALTTGDNWCRAVGSSENDAANGSYCINDQPNRSIEAQSWCAELGPSAMAKVNGTCSNGTAYQTALECTTAGGTWTANPETWAAGIYHAAKGGMGLQGSATSPSVLWRLPTIYDYQQANIDGIRMVLPDMGIGGGLRPVVDASLGVLNNEWSASVVSVNRTLGWAFAAYGDFRNSSRHNSYAVRCVGR